MKRMIKSALKYNPLVETYSVRNAIENIIVDGLPYCPPYEGDLLFSLIRKNKFKNCLETGFYTGSTALYLAAAVSDHKGHVVSICLDDDESVEQGIQLLQKEGLSDFHHLVRKNSNLALPEFFLSGERFDFIFMDGWKTFDHLAYEVYLFNQLLIQGGVIAFDDTYMPSVRKVIRLLTRYYGYEEIDYTLHNQSLRLRLFHYLTRCSLHPPYRAFKKTIDTEEQLPFQDWNFFRQI